MSAPWFDNILGPIFDEGVNNGKLNADIVLQAVRAWDQGRMWATGRSIMPTELRDAVYEVLSPEGRSIADRVATLEQR